MEIYVTPEIKRLIRGKITDLHTKIDQLKYSHIKSPHHQWVIIIDEYIEPIETSISTLVLFLTKEKISIDEFRTRVYKYIDEMLFELSPEFLKNVILSCYRLRNPLSPSSTESEEETCGICLEQLSDGICIVPCNSLHIFHCNCIDKWRLRKNTCPNCSKELNGSNIKIEDIGNIAYQSQIDYIISILYTQFPELETISVFMFYNLILNNAVLYYIYKLCLTCRDKDQKFDSKLNIEQWESKAAEIKKEADAATNANKKDILLAQMITTMKELRAEDMESGAKAATATPSSGATQSIGRRMDYPAPRRSRKKPLLTMGIGKKRKSKKSKKKKRKSKKRKRRSNKR